MRRFKRLAIVTGLVLAGVLAGSAAVAVVSGHSGRASTQQFFVHQTNDSVFDNVDWRNVPNAVRIVDVPRRSTRMIDARFSAESACTGREGWCSARIVVTNARTGVPIELDPASGTDFAFDTVADDGWEGHAMERASNYLSSGRYRVRVQAAVVGEGTEFRLDDWTLAVNVIRP